ncbi:hypothetical protein BU14_1527s0001 [Porphyra umbilicalis]|uniref:Gfo/Idh/MocA-like oxidoreductase N-terminal domain-containing protein n=1 Tax=Porphyra umbilicalis TaxID=2786 RepID=A0A1X6NLL1_PORUM|nr:hypothetical protein BU14_1527s0001 [Porphyra umbilicalis]|eukprot:OSX69420.1 hypothetical protein BU14_1527s0001 [Porphyra umbilicalis]
MAPSPTPPLRVALLGAGIFARTAHLGALAPHVRAGAVTVAAVWSRSAAPAAALASAYADVTPGGTPPPSALSGDAALDSLLGGGDGHAIDAVVLAVPIPALAALSARCLAAGHHVLSEKPLAHSLSAAREVLAAAAAAAGRAPAGERPPPRYAVAENFRFEPAFRRAAALVAAGTAGSLLAVTLTGHSAMPPDSPYAATAWRQAPAHRGGVLSDGGVHSVAALRAVTGRAVRRVVGASVTAGTADGARAAAPDGLAAVVALDGGATAAVSLCFAVGTRAWRLRVAGTEGAVDVERGAREGAGGYWVRWDTRGGGGGGGEEFHPFGGVEAEVSAWVAACRGGDGSKADAVHPLLAGAEAFADLAVIDAVLVAAERGGGADVERLDD